MLVQPDKAAAFLTTMIRAMFESQTDASGPREFEGTIEWEITEGRDDGYGLWRIVGLPARWTANAYETVSLLHAAARRDAATGDPAAKRDSIGAVRDRTQAALDGNEIADMGVVSPVRFVDRVGSQSVWLYRVEDLRTAFDRGKSPAGGSAKPVACLGDPYEKCRKLR